MTKIKSILKDKVNSFKKACDNKNVSPLMVITLLIAIIMLIAGYLALGMAIPTAVINGLYSAVRLVFGTFSALLIIQGSIELIADISNLFTKEGK